MVELDNRIKNYYQALQKLDHKKLADCYDDDAVFQDPAFQLDNKHEIAAMWKMLCTGAKDFEFEYFDIESDDEYGTGKWRAQYTFSQTKRKVVNEGRSYFRFSKEGLITEQTDVFNFWKWSRQALGLPGLFLGWSSFLQAKVQNKLAERMERYL